MKYTKEENRNGSKTAVFHISREETEGHPDVPFLGEPNDDNVKTRTWDRAHQGRKLFRVSGELWCQERIPPGSISRIVRNDRIPSREMFIVDADGNELRGAELERAGRWLWFKPEVAMNLAHRRGG